MSTLEITGEFKTVLTHIDGTTDETDWQTNQIQDDFVVLLAGLSASFDPGDGVGVGINQIAFGTGDDLWFSEGASTARSLTAVALYDEFATQDLTTSDICYVDPDTYVKSSIPTNAIKINVFRGPTAESETHGEFALYGAYNPLTGTRRMVDWGVHSSRITKATTDTLTIPIIIKFSIAR